LAGAKFFIGLSSGLSWLAWAVDIPVVMISGFTKKYNEFYTPYRIINENVCNGCWNDTNIKFDKSNWFWCPRGKNFECSKEISVQSVLEQVKKLI
jgi:autotransporter strand-loop-strand O-heptosyltransferase